VAQSVLLKAKGLYSFPNQLSEVPAGGLAQADNVIINRDGVIESRRGFAIYGNAMGASASTDFAHQLLTYKNRIIRHFGSGAGTTLQYDNGSGTFTSWSGTIAEVQQGLRIKGVESNGNLYLTTAAGIKKISALNSSTLASSTITNAGGIKGLDTELALNEQTGFLTQDGKVAYRVVWGIKDSNNNVILGTPSERTVIANPITDLLITDFNRLLTELDAAAVLDGGDDLGDTDYASLYTVPANSAATLVQANMSAVCTKLDADLGSTTFAATKTEIDAINLDIAPSTGQLEELQEAFDEIVTLLNALIDSGGSPTIDGDVPLFIGSTQSATVDLTITVPEDVTTAHFYQIYRTAVAVSSAGTNLSDIDPGDECGLVYEDNPSSAEITAGLVEVHDVTPESFRGANLYTNPNSGEGIAQANEVPPMSTDISLYKNYLFYANTQTKYRRRINLLSVTNLTPDVSTFTITDGDSTNTYTFSTTEDQALKKVKISTADTPAQQVDETARSLVRVVNRNDDELVYAYYLSGPSDVPGLILFESRDLGSDAFYFNVGNSSYADQFNPQLPTSGSSVIADNEVAPNRIFHSKVNQPEAVPLVNYFDVGPKDKKIQRILALRESLFVLKEEGIYRVSGDSAPFVVNLFDSSTLVTAPDTAVVLNNQIYVLTDQGVAQISDTGVSIISRPIEGDLIKLNNPSYTAFETASFGCAYESDRTFFLWTVTDTSDTKATQCYRYNTFTNAWYRAPVSKTCAVINPADDKMYLGAADTNFIEKERKNYDRTDYADREYDFSISSGAIDGTVITLPSVTNVEERDVVLQTQYLTISQFNRLLSKLDLDNGVNDDDYSTLAAVAGDNLRTKLTTLADKLDADTGVTDTDYASTISAYTTSFVDTQSAFNDIVEKLNLDTGVVFSNYLESEGTITYEVIITDVDTRNLQITTEYAYPFIAGTVTIFKHIECVVRYAPQTFGDPSTLKQVSESTIMFERTSFSACELGFATDLNPSFVAHPFNGSGNGIVGSGVYGNNTYGGSGNAIPFRTLVPREKQRCRFMNVKFEHGTARESFAIFGISLTIVPTSVRAYK
jgi:hypothetical protein